MLIDVKLREIYETDFAYLNACNTCVRQAFKESSLGFQLRDTHAVTKKELQLHSTYRFVAQVFHSAVEEGRFPQKSRHVFRRRLVEVRTRPRRLVQRVLVRVRTFSATTAAATATVVQQTALGH